VRPVSTPALTYERGASGPGSVDLDRFVASRMLIQANSGGGKSRALRQMLEETHGHVQHLVIDPEGEFATLRQHYDYVLAAKSGGDVEANPRTARLLCRRLMELGASAVLDLYDLSLAERRDFVRLFLTELMSLPRTLWRPTVIVIDEAHVFVPERGSGEASSTEAVITLCTQGRKRGYCAVLATQRISKLHKDAAAELLNKLVGRTGLDVDMKRAGDELGMGKEERHTLKALEPGEFFVYGPAISPDVQRVRTGAVRTRHPEAGRVASAPPPPPAKVRAMLAKLADLPQEAESEARSLADLERQNVELRRKLRVAEKGQGGPVVSERESAERVEREASARATAAVDRARAGWTRDLRKLVGRDLTRVRRSLDRLVISAEAIGEQVKESVGAFIALDSTLDGDASSPASAPAATVAVVPPAPRPVTSPSTAAPRQRESVDGSALGRTPRRMLNAILFFERMGEPQPTRANVAGLVGISASTGIFRTYLSELRTHGCITDEPGNRIALSDAGRGLASDEGMPETCEALHATWRSKFGGTPARMFDVLVAAWPEPVSREALAEAVGIDSSTGSFRTYLSELRTSTAVHDVPGTKQVRASDMLFPEGLR